MKLTKLALACALTGSLAACGGGTVQQDRTLSGGASKGLIKGGVVKVYSYSANGTKSDNPIVIGKTDDVGHYSVKIGNNTGLLTVEVSAVAGTTMFDEATNKDISMPTTMVLRSLVQFDNTAIEKITAHVTPFTDMVVTVAEKRGGLTSDNAASAKTSVFDMLGFDPRLTKPIMVANAAKTDTKAEKSQSLRLAALSEIASTPTSVTNLDCDRENEGKIIECVVEKTTGSVAITGTTIDMSDKAKAATNTAYTTVVSNHSDIAGDGTSALFSKPTEVPATPAVVDSIAAAKALFASLRTNLNAFSNAQETGALDVKSDALKADFDKAIAPLDKELADWIRLSGLGITFFNDFKAGSSVNSEYSNCSVYADVTATTLATTPSDAKSVFCNTYTNYAPGTWDEVTGNRTWTYLNKTILLTPVAGSTSFNYASGARMETWRDSLNSSTNNYETLVSKNTIGTDGGGVIGYTMNGNIVTGATINGFMPARSDNMGVAITDQESWNVSYVRTPEAGGVNKYALSGDITALKDDVAVGSVVLKNGSYIRTVSPVGNYEINSEVNLELAVAAGKSKVTGTLSLNNFSADKKGSNYIPTDMKFIGSFTNVGSEFFNGTLTANTSATEYAKYDSSLVDSATNFVKGSISFTGIAKVPNRPDLKLTLTASNPEFNVAEFNAQYNDGTNTVLIDSTNASPKVINISSASGVSLQLKDGVNTANVMRNSSIIAILNRSTGMIDYADGSGESLK